MKNEKPSSLPSIVGDSEGSSWSGPNTKGPTPTVGDIAGQLKNQALMLLRARTAEQGPDGKTERWYELTRLYHAVLDLATEIEVA